MPEESCFTFGSTQNQKNETVEKSEAKVAKINRK